jgi:hypothetical protein
LKKKVKTEIYLEDKNVNKQIALLLVGKLENSRMKHSYKIRIFVWLLQKILSLVLKISHFYILFSQIFV